MKITYNGNIFKAMLVVFSIIVGMIGVPTSIFNPYLINGFTLFFGSNFLIFWGFSRISIEYTEKEPEQ